MSLRIYFADETLIDSENILRDVEIGFLSLKIEGSDLERKALKEIEEASYCDTYSFIDRFGYKLYNKFLSTGCKAILCLINYKDKIINAIECGDNVISFMVENCNGSIIVTRDMLPIITESVIDVIVDSYRFMSVDRLNHYLINERPYEPDMSLEGISCI